MSSGHKRVIINTRERAASGDINREQAFAAAAAQERMRHLHNREIQGSWVNNPGMQEPFRTAIVAPPVDVEVNGDVFGGLMVRPDNAGFLLVDPGSMGMFVPGFAGLGADDTPYVTVNDPGVTDPATLTFTANAGPGIRWDIVECQPVDVVLETEVRDIFDPTPQTFTPTSVDKVSAARLTYRVRNGTQGAGIPDIDPDWMPLAAVHVRTDSAGFSDSDVYDIRPLVAERCDWSMRHPLSPPASSRGTRGAFEEADFAPISDAGLTGLGLQGMFRGRFGGYWTGGDVRKNTPAATAADFATAAAITDGETPWFNLEDARNQGLGFGAPTDAIITVGAFFPRGYPRWVRYSQSPQVADVATRLRKTGRVPQGPRGILAVVPAAGSINGIISPQSLPPVVGETDAAWGHVVNESIAVGAGDHRPAIGGTSDQKFYWPARDLSGGSPESSSAVWPAAAQSGTGFRDGGNTIWQTRFAFVHAHAARIPPRARGILIEVELFFAFSIISATIIVQQSPHAEVLVSNKGISLPSSTPRRYQGFTGLDFELNETIWIPLPIGGTTAWDSDGTLGTTYFMDYFGIISGGTLTADPIMRIRPVGYQF